MMDQKCEKKIVQVIQHTQRATPHKRTKEKEKVKRGDIDIRWFENVKHERLLNKAMIHTIKIRKRWDYGL